MNRNSRRFLAGSLAVAVMISMAACQAKPKEETTTAMTSGAATVTTETTEAIKEPVTLTYMDSQGSPGAITPGVQTDPVSLEILKATGVTIDWDTTASGDKINALIASGSLPDILVMDDKSKLNTLIESEAVLDLTTLIESNDYNFKTVWENALTFSKNTLSNDTGKIFAIPTRVTTGDASSVYFQPYIGFHIRWDYYNEIGAPEFKSFDDVANALIQIQKNHPTTAEGKNTYALSMWQDWGLWNYIVISQVVRGIGSYGSANIAQMDKDYNFIDGLNDPQSSYWVDGAFYNKLYQAGVLDPDSFTQGNAQATAKMDAGQDICQLAYWMVNTQNAELSKTNADYLSIPVAGSNYNAAQYNPVGSKFFVISSKCKYPERAMDLINWMCSDEGTRTMLNGVKGDTWTVDESGKASMTEKGLTLKSDPDYIINTGAGKYLNSTGIDPFSLDSTGKQFVDMFNEPDYLASSLTGAQKEWLAFFNSESSNELWHENGGYAQNSIYSMFVAPQSEEFKRTDANIVAYLQSALPELIMAKDDAAFAAQKAKIIKEITEMSDYAAYIAEAKQAITAAKAEGDKYN